MSKLLSVLYLDVEVKILLLEKVDGGTKLLGDIQDSVRTDPEPSNSACKIKLIILSFYSLNGTMERNGKEWKGMESDGVMEHHI